MLNYLRSIKVSQRIFDMVMECIDNANECKYDIRGCLNTFNNCREQGYYANIYGLEQNDYQNLYIWVHEHKNSDAIVVRWSTSQPEDNGMFSEDTCNNRSKYFNYDEEHDVVNFIMDLIMKHLKYRKELEKEIK